MMQDKQAASHFTRMINDLHAQMKKFEFANWPNLHRVTTILPHMLSFQSITP